MSSPAAATNRRPNDDTVPQIITETKRISSFKLNVGLLEFILGCAIGLALPQARICLAKFQNDPMPMIAPPLANSFAQLARSPASSQLANEFFAAERARALSLAPNGAAVGEPNPTAAPGAAGPLKPISWLNMGLASNGVGGGAGRSSLVSPLANLSISSPTPSYSLTLDGAFRLDQYHRLEEIYAYLDSLARRYKNVQVFTIGKTNENRPIKALELINNATDSDFIWLDALTHAREWITGTTILYTIDRLIAGGGGASGSSYPDNNNNSNRLLFAKNYIIVPVVNPDGYAYTWSTNRMWRKNRSGSRSRAPASKCIGADLNRNFDHSFGGEGASSDPCSHIYSGPRAFSEPETRAMAEMMWSLRNRIKFYLTMHSFNQLWACPYAHTTEQTAHLGTHMRVLRSIQRAVFEAEGVAYEIGPLSTSLYVGSGFGIDFAYDKCAIVHSYLVELRDRGANGFVLPADQIMPTARETFAGLRAGIRAALAS